MERPTSLRLSFRRVVDDDAEFLRCLEQDPDCRRFIGQLPVPRTESTAILFVFSSDGEPTGMGGFVESEARERGEFEILCCVAQTAKRRGFGIEACEALLAWAWSETSWASVLACAHKSNPGGLGVVARLGFSDIGIRTSNNDIRVLEMKRRQRAQPEPA